MAEKTIMLMLGIPSLESLLLKENLSALLKTAKE
jgi:hypothetical protein